MLSEFEETQMTTQVPGLWVGIDAGKGHHWWVAIDDTRTTIAGPPDTGPSGRVTRRRLTRQRKGESTVGVRRVSSRPTIWLMSKPSMSARNSGLDRYASSRSCTSSASL